jgi:hypothetical protein
MPPRTVGSSVTGAPRCRTVPDETRVGEDGLARRQDDPLQMLQRHRGHDDRERCENRQHNPQRNTHVPTTTNVRCGPAEVCDPTTAITAPSRVSTTKIEVAAGGRSGSDNITTQWTPALRFHRETPSRYTVGPHFRSARRGRISAMQCSRGLRGPRRRSPAEQPLTGPAGSGHDGPASGRTPTARPTFDHHTLTVEHRRAPA